MCPHVASEVFPEPVHSKAHVRPLRKRAAASRAVASKQGRWRYETPKIAAALASGVRGAKIHLGFPKLRTPALRLWSTQRYALLLVAMDLTIGFGFLVFESSKPLPAALAGIGLLPLWLIVWLASSSVAGGFSPLAAFSSRRQIAASLMLSFHAGTTALAICSLIAVFSAQSLGEANFIPVIITVTGISAVARIMLIWVWPAKIVVVTREHESLPPGYSPGPAVRHLRLTDSQIAEPKVLVAEIGNYARDFDASAVEIVGDMGLPDQIWRSLSWELREQHASLRFPIAGAPLRQHRVHCAVRGGRGIVEISAPVRPLGMRLAKRTTDVVGASGLLVVFFPVLVLVACAVKLTSRGPVLYKQERVGCKGQLFEILKFRTMADGSDAMLHDLLKAQNRGDAPLFKVADDPRVTPLGAILRRYSLDELPQLFNVLNGSMSLVGPRPQRPAEVALYRGDAGHRLGVRPGMTGLWQVNGRSRLSWEEAQQMDIDYAHNWSIWEDINILVRTARVVIAADGAI